MYPLICTLHFGNCVIKVIYINKGYRLGKHNLRARDDLVVYVNFLYSLGKMYVLFAKIYPKYCILGVTLLSQT